MRRERREKKKRPIHSLSPPLPSLSLCLSVLFCLVSLSFFLWERETAADRQAEIHTCSIIDIVGLFFGHSFVLCWCGGWLVGWVSWDLPIHYRPLDQCIASHCTALHSLGWMDGWMDSILFVHTVVVDYWLLITSNTTIFNTTTL